MTRMNFMPRLCLASLLALASFAASAQTPSSASLGSLNNLMSLDQGLQPLHWQARLQLNSLDASNPLGPRLLSANLLGDYYLTGSLLGHDTSGGFRATGGVMLGPLSLLQSSGGLALGDSSLSLRQGLAVGQRNVGVLNPYSPLLDSNSGVSYLGIGYTGQSLRGGWGFSADLGLARPDGLRLGHSAQLVDENWGDTRFLPVLQLGLNFRF